MSTNPYCFIFKNHFKQCQDEKDQVDLMPLIVTAQVYQVAIETPLQVAKNLSKRLGSTVLLKREDLQPVFSFKCRGAYNRMHALTEPERRAGGTFLDSRLI